ncbi:MAG: hypothetical protein L0209_11725, partial [candidate division Zixibacteria bacterium]|nr:hypothetical protein [candidate division Zixibacteria bacterium]
SYSVTLTVYDADVGGNVLWAETTSITTAGGLFTILLGASNPVPDSVFNDSSRYLGVAVSSDPEMTPRQKLVSVPFSSGNWSTSGNGGTEPGRNFLGTTDSMALELKVNNTRALRLEPAGAGGQFPNVVGGIGHFVTTGAYSAVIGGGASNRVSDNYGTVGGGFGNWAGDLVGTTDDREFATIGGGLGNRASGYAATVAGGESNQATGQWATVAGGIRNRAIGQYASVGGGLWDSAQGYSSWVAGGLNNTAFGSQSTVGGGGFNYAGGNYATVGGGSQDSATALYSTVSGGHANRATNNSATVGGGQSDTASGVASTVPGGFGNKAQGDRSFAAGSQAKAIHHGSFVWADNQFADFASTTNNQFSIRAQNGLRLADSAGAAKSVAIGEHYRDNGIVAWGRVTGSTGAIAGEFGVTSVVRTGAGSYNVTINAAAASSSLLVPTATALSTSGTVKIINISVTGASTFSVFTYTTGPALSDTDFSFMVTGR